MHRKVDNNLAIIHVIVLWMVIVTGNEVCVWGMRCVCLWGEWGVCGLHGVSIQLKVFIISLSWLKLREGGIRFRIFPTPRGWGVLDSIHGHRDKVQGAEYTEYTRHPAHIVWPARGGGLVEGLGVRGKTKNHDNSCECVHGIRYTTNTWERPLLEQWRVSRTIQNASFN